MKPLQHGDKPFAPGVELGQFHGPFHALGTAVGEKAILNVAGRQFSDHLGQMGPQWIQHLLAVLRAAIQLGLDRGHYFRVTDTGRIEAESAEHVNVFPSHDVTQNRSPAPPVRQSEVICFGYGFTIFQKAFIDVVGKVAVGFFSHPRSGLPVSFPIPVS